MGHIIFRIRDFYDSTSELVAIKSGIILNRFNISKILRDTYKDDFLLDDNLDKGIRIGSDVVTNMVIDLRANIGNLSKHSTKSDYKVLEHYLEKQKNIETLSIVSTAYYLLINNPNSTRQDLIKKIIEKRNIDEILANAALNIAIENEDTSIVLNSGTNWDGMTPLDKLFNIEVKPKNEIDFIDQKFIDYLSVNGHEIETIHWRNFERFCAEYFKRQGYHVVLGPGTNDGGTDIRVFKDKNDLNSSLILIQCKRYKEDRKVTIESVKSFYADVLFEGAQEGIIATTGYIASGGKKVCQVRKYNISFAEKINIKNWAKNMTS